MRHRSLPAFAVVLGTLVTAVVSFLVVMPAAVAAVVGFSEVTGFGSNPGNQRMFIYVPAGAPANAPVVVLFHGCGGAASGLDVNTGWRKYADTYRFNLVMPEQKPENVGSGGIVPHKCFSAWNESDRTHAGQGEALSVIQMVEYMRTNYAADLSRLYVTGYSGGGAATNVMLAAYPDRFKAGAVFFGMPFACADTESAYFRTGSLGPCSGSTSTLTPAQWGTKVRNAYPGYIGPRPKVQLWHGGSDPLISPKSLDYQRDQWTDVFGLNQTPTATSTPKSGVTKAVYGSGQVESYLISSMGHEAPIDPGSAIDKCGTSGQGYTALCGPYYASLFFGLNAGPTSTPPPSPTVSPTASPTPTGSPTPTASPTAAGCFTATNSQHVAAGRAEIRGLSAYAIGSGDYLGTRSSAIQRSLLQTGPNAYARVTSCP